ANADLQAAGKSAEEIAALYRDYLGAGNREGDASVEGDRVTLRFHGVSVHGMDPGKGVNAGTELIHFLTTLSLDERAEQFVQFTD
ncbi:peptidase dimerization domain-containing protein, partial [Frankia sp. Cpl3]|nr:peptidase dimerization domain-containing protein [Frankia sp. Cpl3]